MGSYEKLDLKNEAAWSKEAKANVEVGEAKIYEPGSGELLVKNECIAFAPVDFKNQKFLLHPMHYPGILGSSFAGTVEKVGSDVSDFARGDKVACNRPCYGFENYRYGAFQKYVVASVNESSRLDARTPIQEAAAVILNLAATVAALAIHLGLDRPPSTGRAMPKGKKVLVYGGSSSCGGYAVKYAVDAGYGVVTTSSPKNHDFVEKLGPTTIIDHTQPSQTVVSELRANGPYDAIFDPIGIPPVTNIFVDYLGEGGGEYVTLLPLLGGEKPIPPNVKRRFCTYIEALVEKCHRDLGRWFYQEYVPKGLLSGAVIPTRQIEVEGGLAQVQKTVDSMGPKGVSGHKLVMQL